MKKKYILAISVLGLCGSLMSLNADTGTSAGMTGQANAQNCMFTSEEQAFAAQLSDANKATFCGMTREKRADCMQMMQTTDAYGNKMTADQAVQSISGSGGCSID